MNVSIGPRWEKFVSKAVETGRYGSASEVVREGLRLVEEREARLQALRESLDSAIAEDTWHSAEHVEATVSATLDKAFGGARAK